MVRKKTQAQAEATVSSETSSLEAQKQTARELLEQDTPEDMIVKQTGLSPMVIRGLKSGLTRARKRSATVQNQVQTVQSVEAEANKPAQAEASNIPQADGEGVELPYRSASPRSIIVESMPSPSSPNQTIANPSYDETSLPSAPLHDGTFTLSYEEVQRLKDMVPKGAKQDLWDDTLRNIQERKRLERERMSRHNGHGSEVQAGRAYPSDELEHEIAMTLKQERGLAAIDSLRRRKQEPADAGNLTKQAFDMAKLILSLQQQGQSPSQIDQAVQALTLSYLKNPPSPTGAVNAQAIQLEALKQTGELERDKLMFEVKKWEYQQQSGDKTLEAIKGILSGPIGETIKMLGGSAAERVRPKTQGEPQPKLVQIGCPRCGAKFLANPELPTIQCAQCGSTLSKEQPQELKPLIREIPQEPAIKQIETKPAEVDKQNE